ncbi:MAG: hypothetical protein LUQ47_06570 [Methanotrichaceae archaeon]|nr:hypothetical protein [Methanotrichaceae archaeon]
MKIALIIAFILVSWNFLAISNSKVDGFQSVSGDSARSLLDNLQAEKSKPAEEKDDSLWAWGDAPKGRIIVNGSLATDPYYIWKSLNYTKGWLGKAYVDPTTGYPVYAYIDPYTGSVQNFYVDPNTGGPVYMNTYQGVEFPFYDSNPSWYSPSYSSGGFGLPAIFSSNDPWT